MTWWFIFWFTSKMGRFTWDSNRISKSVLNLLHPFSQKELFSERKENSSVFSTLMHKWIWITLHIFLCLKIWIIGYVYFFDSSNSSSMELCVTISFHYKTYKGEDSFFSLVLRKMVSRGKVKTNKKPFIGCWYNFSYCFCLTMHSFCQNTRKKATSNI